MTYQGTERRVDPIKREAYAEVYGLFCDLESLGRLHCSYTNRNFALTVLNRFFPIIGKKIKSAEDKGYEECMTSWCRALGNRILNKRHLIDAVVVTTQRLNENEVALLSIKKEMMSDLRKAKEESYIGLTPSPLDFEKYIAMISKVTTP